MDKFLERIARLDAHQRLFIGLATSTLVLGIVYGRLPWITQAVIVWISYACTVLSLMWTTILNAHPAEIRKRIRLQDSSRIAIFIFVVLAALISLFAVMYLINSIEGEGAGKVVEPRKLVEHIILALLSISCAWFLVHTLFTIHYAHIYYCDDDNSEKVAGGLAFPEDDMPDYLDFAYFSFVIGMTSQVSDVQITKKPMRRLALVHGLLAFLFNALIVALTINTVSGLLGR